MTAPVRRAGRARLPIGPRYYQGRESRTVCVATNLAPDEIATLDSAAGSLGESRSEFIRRAIHQRLAQKATP
jgi:hypothetical protein